MISLAYASRLTAYNRWMNERLYDCCAKLSEEERQRDVGAFFKSIHGTLNHLLLGDRVWLGRFTRVPFVVKSLDQELYADFDELRMERDATDAAIAQWASSLSEDDLASELSYTSIVNPESRRCPLWFAVAHFFNHQTHHRGQVTTLLAQHGIDPGVTDLLWLPEPQVKSR
ncbi:MAG: damage-inducible protein DinB [Betaproteobacteria bacterium]|nr:damage-inducible protein DinB [Betaproteobacteria bacterium]